MELGDMPERSSVVDVALGLDIELLYLHQWTLRHRSRTPICCSLYH
jgi:hypothetical protein